MLWYGLRKTNTKNSIQNYKNRTNFKIRSLNLFLNTKIRFNFFTFYLYLPPKWNLIAFKPLTLPTNLINFFLFSPTYYFFLSFPFSDTQIYFDKKVNSLIIKSLFVTNFFNIYWFLYKNIFYSFTRIFFKKLKFRGKGYYIYKNYRNTIAMQFGYSHRLRIYGYFLSVKFLSKISVLIFGINNKDVYNMGYSLFYKRPINVFTGKGVRFTRQIIYRKTGKVGSYR